MKLIFDKQLHVDVMQHQKTKRTQKSNKDASAHIYRFYLEANRGTFSPNHHRVMLTPPSKFIYLVNAKNT